MYRPRVPKLALTFSKSSEEEQKKPQGVCLFLRHLWFYEQEDSTLAIATLFHTLPTSRLSIFLELVRQHERESRRAYMAVAPTRHFVLVVYQLRDTLLCPVMLKRSILTSNMMLNRVITDIFCQSTGTRLFYTVLHAFDPLLVLP